MSPYDTWSPQGKPAEATIPVILDGMVREGGPGYVGRCVYFSIVADEPRTNWTLGLEMERIPFVMLGLQGIIHRPVEADEEEFIHPWLLEKLIRRVEEQAGMSVETEFLWLPGWLLEQAWSVSPATEREAPQPTRGSLFRVAAPLFAAAFRAARDGTGFDTLWEGEVRVGEGPEPALRYSPVETEAVRRWSREQAVESANFDRGGSDRGGWAVGGREG